MRPRVFPAEDDADYYETTRIVSASMRPRVFPAEDAERRRIMAARNRALQ